MRSLAIVQQVEKSVSIINDNVWEVKTKMERRRRGEGGRRWAGDGKKESKKDVERVRAEKNMKGWRSGGKEGDDDKKKRGEEMKGWKAEEHRSSFVIRSWDS